MSTAPVIALAMWLAAAPPLARAAPERGSAYLDELLARARSLRLADDPAWLRLGHWRATLRGWKSEADGPAFFLSPRGKRDPGAELEATLRGFLDGRRTASEEDDPQCRFPARFAFLSRRLGFDAARLTHRACPNKEDFLAKLQARSVTLVFSSYYLNNPVSSFGHTFLRMNKAEEARSGKHFELLDYGIDYSAVPDTNNPVLYAIKGLVGMFRGNFNRIAYYYKVREYADAESRDLWEYDLDLNSDEVAMLAAHLWELGGTWFDYWYLDENCSYHILGALEAAVPRVSLIEHVGTVVLPSDTVKALFRNPGFVRGIHYRPSIRTQFEARARALDGEARKAVAALVADASTPLSDAWPQERRAAVLDAAVDLLDLRFFRALAVAQAPEAARERQVLLERRSAIRVVSEPLEIPIPLARAPDRGHGSFRLGAGGGWSTREEEIARLELRVALHDLADPPDGYPMLSQIEFLPVRLRLAPRERRAELDEGWLLRIVSLNQLSLFDTRPSWRLKVGAATIRDGACRSCLAPQVEVGAGFTVPSVGIVDVYAGADASVEWSPRLDGIDGRPIRAGIGPGGIARLRLGNRAVLLGDARLRWLPAASPGWTHEIRGTLRLHLFRGLSVSIEARRTPGEDEISGAVLGYF